MTESTETLTSSSKWLITATVMIVAVMEVLDMTIVNVALPHMMGSFGATISEITWVVTAYVVASAIMMPMTGYLVGRFGQKRLLIINIVGFLIASMLCGTSTSLLEIIIFRALQGIFGASLIPLSQFILRATFEKHELGKAMAVWAMGILVGPIMGPTLGGYITENLSWHWIFFINVPVCLIALVLTTSLIKETRRENNAVDLLGVILLALGVGCFQTFIEEGYHYDWFSSSTILILLLVSIFSVAAFVIRGINNPRCVIDLNIFRDRQFVMCTLILALFSCALFGALVMQPVMTETLLGYPANLTGLLMAPRGLVSLLLMPLTPLLMKHFNCKWIILTGIALTAFGTYMMTGWSLQVDFRTMVLSSIVQGMGMALVFSPTSTIVFETLAPRLVASGTGMFSFGRNIGLSVGVAVLSTVLANQTQVNWNRLGQHINPFNPNLQSWLNAQHLSINAPTTPAQLANLLNQHANMVSYLDVYLIATFCFALLIPVVFLIPKGRVTGRRSMDAH